MLKRLGICLAPIVFAFFLNGCVEDRAAIKERSLLHLRLGASHLSEGNIPSALKELLEAKKINPDDPHIYSMLGLAYGGKKEYEKAIDNFRKALEINPELPEVHNNFGTLYLHLKRWDDAILEFRKAVNNDLYSTPERAYCNMGWAYYKKGDMGRAIQNYKKASEIDPEFILPYYNLGVGYLSIDKTDEAIAAFKLAVKLAPGYVDAHYRLGLVYFKLGMKEDAKREFEEVVTISPPGETRSSAKTYLDLLN